MDVKALGACFQSASKISQTVEEYEFLAWLSSIVCHDFTDSRDDVAANLLSDELLKTIDFISKEQGIVLTSSAVLDWYGIASGRFCSLAIFYCLCRLIILVL